MPDRRACLIAAAAGPPLGPAVFTVTVTGTAAPFKLTVDGSKLRVTPGGSIVLGKGLSMTVLGVFDNGVTLITTALDCPAVTVMVVSRGKLKSGTFTSIPIAFEAASKFPSPAYPACTLTNCACGVSVRVAVRT
jgi:hypothetical protein